MFHIAPSGDSNVSARATKNQNKTNSPQRWNDYLWLDFFLLNCLLIDFSGIFHHLTFASSTRKTDIHHTSIYSQFEMHSWYIITQWPRCSTTNIKKTIEMMQMKKKNWIFGGCERTFHRRFMHTNVTRSKCENYL